MKMIERWRERRRLAVCRKTPPLTEGQLAAALEGVNETHPLYQAVQEILFRQAEAYHDEAMRVDLPGEYRLRCADREAAVSEAANWIEELRLQARAKAELEVQAKLQRAGRKPA